MHVYFASQFHEQRRAVMTTSTEFFIVLEHKKLRQRETKISKCQQCNSFTPEPTTLLEILELWAAQRYRHIMLSALCIVQQGKETKCA